MLLVLHAAAIAFAIVVAAAGGSTANEKDPSYASSLLPTTSMEGLSTPLHPLQDAHVVHRTVAAVDADPKVTRRYHVHIAHPAHMVPHPRTVDARNVSLRCRTNDTLLVSTKSGDVASTIQVGDPIVNLRTAAGCSRAPDMAIATRVDGSGRSVMPNTEVLVVTVRAAEHHELFASNDTDQQAPLYFSTAAHAVVSPDEAAALMQDARSRYYTPPPTPAGHLPWGSRSDAHGERLQRLAEERIAAEHNRTSGNASSSSDPKTEQRNFHAQAYLTPTCASTATAGGTLRITFNPAACTYDPTSYVYQNSNSAKFAVSRAQYASGYIDIPLGSSAVTISTYFSLYVPSCYWAYKWYENTNTVTISPNIGFSPLMSSLTAGQAYRINILWAPCTTRSLTVEIWQDLTLGDKLLGTATIDNFDSAGTTATLTLPSLVDTYDDAYLYAKALTCTSSLSVELYSTQFTLNGVGDPVSFTKLNQGDTIRNGVAFQVSWTLGNVPITGTASLQLWSKNAAQISSQVGASVTLTPAQFAQGTYSFVTWSAASSSLNVYFYMTYTPQGNTQKRDKYGAWMVLVGTSVAVVQFTTPANFGLFDRVGTVPFAMTWGGGTSADANAKLELRQSAWFLGSASITSWAVDMSGSDPSGSLDLSKITAAMKSATPNPAFFLRVSDYNCLKLPFVASWCDSADSSVFFLPYAVSVSTPSYPATVFNWSCASCGTSAAAAPSSAACSSFCKSINSGQSQLFTDLSLAVTSRSPLQASMSFSRFWWTGSVTGVTTYALNADGAVSGQAVLDLDLAVSMNGQTKLPDISPVSWTISFFFFSYSIIVGVGIAATPQVTLNVAANGFVTVTMPVNRRVSISAQKSSSTGTAQYAVTIPDVSDSSSSGVSLSNVRGSADVEAELALIIAPYASAGPQGSAWVSVVGNAKGYVKATVQMAYPGLAPRVFTGTYAWQNFAACSSAHYVDVEIVAGAKDITLQYSLPIVGSGSSSIADKKIGVFAGCYFAVGTYPAPAFTLTLTAEQAASFNVRTTIASGIARGVGIRPSSVFLTTGGASSSAVAVRVAERAAAADTASTDQSLDVYLGSVNSDGNFVATPSYVYAAILGTTIAFPGGSVTVPAAPTTAAPPTPSPPVAPPSTPQPPPPTPWWWAPPPTDAMTNSPTASPTDAMTNSPTASPTDATTSPSAIPDGTTTASPSAAAAADSPSGTSVGTVAGITSAVVAISLVAVVALVLVRRSRQLQRHAPAPQPSAQNDTPTSDLEMILHGPAQSPTIPLAEI